MEIASAFVAIRPKVDQGAFQSETTSAITKPLAKAGREGGEAAGKEMNSALATSAKRAATTLGSAFAGVQLGRKLFDSIQAASALEEQANRVKVVFGDAAGSVEAFAATAAQAIGQSERSALSATGSFGGLFTTLGIGQGEAAQMSITLTKLASDFASFKDIPITEAITAISSGLVGETEPLRRLDVILNEVVIKQKALDLQLVKSATGPLPAAAKVQAIYALILEQSGNAMDDFTNTRESAANTEKRATSEMENAAASLGENFLPIYQRATDLVGDLAAVFGKLPGPAQTAAVAIAGIAVGAVPIVNALATFRLLQVATLAQAAASTTAASAQTAHTATVINYDAVARGATVATSRFSVATSALGTTAAAAAVGIGTFTATTQVLNQFLESPPDTGRLELSLKGLAEGGTAAGALVEEFGVGIEGLGGKIKHVANETKASRLGGIFTGDIFANRNIAKEIQNTDEALANLVETEGVETARLAYGHLAAAALEGGASLEDIVRVFPKYRAAAGDAAIATDDLADEMTTAQQTALALRDALIAPRAAALEAADALTGVTDAQRDLAEARADAAGTGERAIAAAKRERDAERSLADAYESSADAADTLRDARQELAEFESGSEARVRELERIQIVRREITTPEEARQKEIDLLRFDEGVADERERLQEGIADAEEGVADAAEKVADAQATVRDATAERAQVTTEALARIEEAERDVERAVLDALDAYIAIVEEQGEAGVGAIAWRDTLREIAGLLAPGSDIRTGIESMTAFTGPLSFLNPTFTGPLTKGQSSIVAARQAGTLDTGLLEDIAAGTNKAFTLDQILQMIADPAQAKLFPNVVYMLRALGIPGFASGGTVAGPVGQPQLAVVHGGEQITPPGSSSGGVSIVQNNQFVGGDVPTVTQLDAQNRKLGIRIGLWGRR